jgi:hypothetical protein
MDVLTGPRNQWRSLGVVAAILAVGALFGIGGAWAKGALTQAEISACLDANGYLYQPPGGGTCRAGTLTWNQQGPPGPVGPQGPTGPQGLPGQTKGIAYGKTRIRTALDTFPLAGSATAMCKSNERLVGGGYQLKAIGLGYTKVTVHSNGPLMGVVQGAGNGWSTSVLVQGYHGKQTPVLYVRAICIEVL